MNKRKRFRENKAKVLNKIKIAGDEICFLLQPNLRWSLIKGSVTFESESRGQTISLIVKP